MIIYIKLQELHYKQMYKCRVTGTTVAAVQAAIDACTW